MNYLLPLKMNKDAEPIKQFFLQATEALNFVRAVMLSFNSMEETTADLKAISFMKDVKPGNAQAIQNNATSHILVVQVHDDTD